MRLKQAAAVIRIPSANAIVQAAFRQGIHFLQPIEVAGNLPIAKDFHDASQLPVGGGVKIVFDRAFGKRGAKRDVAVFIHGAPQFQFAQSALQAREKVRESLRIIPDVRAGTMAAARVGKTSFPTPKIAIFQPQHGGRFQDG